MELAYSRAVANTRNAILKSIWVGNSFVAAATLSYVVPIVVSRFAPPILERSIDMNDDGVQDKVYRFPDGRRIIEYGKKPVPDWHRYGPNATRPVKC